MTDGLFSMNRDKLPNLEKEELWHLAAWLSLCVMESCIYSLTVFFLQHSITSVLMSTHSDSSFLLSLLLSSLSLLVPKSDSDRWWSRLSRQSPSPFHACRQTGGSTNGAPHEFPSPGSDPILHWRWRQCEFFMCLNLRARIYLQGCQNGAMLSHAPYTATPGRRACGSNTLFYWFSHKCLRLLEPISTWRMGWLCLSPGGSSCRQGLKWYGNIKLHTSVEEDSSGFP